MFYPYKFKVFLVTAMTLMGCQEVVESQEMNTSGVSDSCRNDCEGTYSDATMIELCTTACMEQPELFHVDYPYLFGPLTMEPHPEITGQDIEVTKTMTGTVWARVNAERNRMQFR